MNEKLAAARVAAVPKPGTVLYQADWSGGIAGWKPTGGWQVSDGQFLNDGTNCDPRNYSPAPFVPDSDLKHYAIELDVQVVKHFDDCGFGSSIPAFGIVVRGNDGQGYYSGFAFIDGTTAEMFRQSSGGVLQSNKYTIAESKMNTYRVEVNSNVITFSYNGEVVLKVTDNSYLNNGKVGIWANKVQASVRGFRVIAL